MKRYYYIGLDIHKKIIAYCVKAIDGCLIDQGKIAADRQSLEVWVKGLPGPWIGAMEATMFTGWVYDFLKPHAIACPEGSSSCDAEGHNSRQEKERSCRCQENSRSVTGESSACAVARKLVAYMLAVDKKQAKFKLPAATQAA